MNWHNQNKEGGFVAIGIAAAAVGVSLVGYYMTSQSTSSSFRTQRAFESRIESIDFINSASNHLTQLSQANLIQIDEDTRTFIDDNIFVKSVANGGFGGSFGSGGANKSLIEYTGCVNPEVGSFVNYLDGTSNAVDCPKKYRVRVSMRLDGVVELVENVSGTDVTRRYMNVHVSLVSTDQDIKTPFHLNQKLLVRMPDSARSSSEVCPFTQHLEDGFTGSPFIQDQYIQHGRAYVGWTKVGINQNQAGGAGYNKLHWRRELFADWKDNSDHWHLFWLPSDENTTRRSWLTYVGGQNWHMALLLHIPVADPGACFFTAKLNRRPAHSNIDNGCFKAGTKIRMASMRSKPIEQVEAGDMVYNPITKKPTRVLRTTVGPEKEPFVTISMGKKKVVVTTKHVFETNHGLKQAKDLDPQKDLIIDHRRRYREFSMAVNPHAEGKEPLVYNLYVSADSNKPRDHMVEADGIVTGDLFLQEKLLGADSEAINASYDEQAAKGRILSQLKYQAKN